MSRSSETTLRLAISIKRSSETLICTAHSVKRSCETLIFHRVCAITTKNTSLTNGAAIQSWKKSIGQNTIYQYPLIINRVRGLYGKISDRGLNSTDKRPRSDIFPYRSSKRGALELTLLDSLVSLWNPNN
ncbi:hypothetical protein AC249_AIPGENE20271 [Exaiptasia diaphana]|nr:hypothetical protein AC249_AIPGENE20271 [Exaiptasia diaphana]